MMVTVAKFLVEDTFYLHQRGIVLLGQIVEGNISPGDHVLIGADNSVQIKDIESVRKLNHPSTIGLRMGNAIIPEADLDRIKGQELIITSL